MPMTDDAPQTVARLLLLLWDGQHGQALRMAEPRPDDEEDEDNIDDEEDSDDEEDEEEEES
jgi:hypothetical protein